MNFPSTTGLFTTAQDRIVAVGNYASRKTGELGNHLLSQYKAESNKFGKSAHEIIGHACQRSITAILALYSMQIAAVCAYESVKALLKVQLPYSAINAVAVAVFTMSTYGFVSLTLDPIGFPARLNKAFENPTQTIKNIFA